MKKCEIVITYNENQYKEACNRFAVLSDGVYEGAFGGTQFYSNYDCIAVVHRYFKYK